MQSPEAMTSPTTTTILMLSASPRGEYPLRLDEERREIEEGLLRSQHRDQFQLITENAVRPKDVRRAMLNIKPQIVHFSGHGAGESGLLFENETGQPKFVDGNALAGLFKLFPQVECVLLNACYSETQAEAIIEHVPYVVGMSQAIGDPAAIEFAVGFYDALGAGYDIEFAFSVGCNAIQMAGIAEHLTPKLKRKPNVGAAILSVGTMATPTFEEKEESTPNNLDSPLSYISETDNKQKISSVSSTSFFHQRFQRAFPGVRGIQTFSSPSEAIVRLAKLLEDPLPDQLIYWLRGFINMPIDSFKHLENDIVLIDGLELKIKNIIAVNAGSYYQCFVYIETFPMEPCGLYNWKEGEIESEFEKSRYFREEFAIYQGELVTRNEYDDGAAYINGKLVELDSSTELRERYLSPYNLVIAAANSPIDESIEEILNNMLRGNANIEDLKRAVLKLPKPPYR